MRARDAARLVVDDESCNGYAIRLVPHNVGVNDPVVTANVRGYPISTPHPPNWQSGRPFIDTDSANISSMPNHSDCWGMIPHYVDTTGGQSGSPIVANFSGDKVIGMHTQGGLGTGNSNACWSYKNSGPRMTDSAVRFSLGY